MRPSIPLRTASVSGSMNLPSATHAAAPDPETPPVLGEIPPAFEHLGRAVISKPRTNLMPILHRLGRSAECQP